VSEGRGVANVPERVKRRHRTKGERGETNGQESSEEAREEGGKESSQEKKEIVTNETRAAPGVTIVDRGSGRIRREKRPTRSQSRQ
jgi:hypothetical protein